MSKEQLAPTARAKPQLLLILVKGLQTPEKESDVASLPPVLVTVTVWVCVPPTATFPMGILEGENETEAGATPLPEREIEML